MAGGGFVRSQRCGSAAVALVLGASYLLGSALTGSALAASKPAEATARGPARPYDFNGDGYRDLAIGSPTGSVGGKGGAGFVSVVYGSRKGLNTRRKRFFSQNSPGVPGAAERGDQFGNSVASADFNRDGYADLAVGAPGEDSGRRRNAGVVTILWGSRAGLSRAAASTEARAGGGHRFGESLAVGDIQHDGSPELFVTVPGTSSFTWLYFRSAAMSAAGGMSYGTIRAASRAATDSWVTAGDVNGDGRDDVVYAWYDRYGAPIEARRGFTIFHGMANGRFKRGRTVHTVVHSLAVGDFNGDRRADIAVGQADDAPGTGGQVTVFHGGLGRGYAINPASPGVPGDPNVDDVFGSSLAVGDANRDGRADLAVGAPKADVGRKPDAGRVYLLYGSPAGLTGRRAQFFTQDTRGVPGRAEEYDHFGFQVSLLDHNRDGAADLTAGAPGDDRDNGAVTFIRGTPRGLSATGSIGLTSTTLGVRGKNAQLGSRLGRLA